MSEQANRQTPVERALAIEREVGHVASQYGMKSADKQFLRDLIERNRQSLSPLAEKWLADIEDRVFGDEDG